ncbi:MFS transporter [Georgenia sp. TF02-10]|uniref:MFS transporter n=1 Tax=Georgenia sp. TF02-10 TaxID=2917725 RepID=UPI001FA7F2FA|nr:MFS transporter [Georgenia sp. TF02-10]UNX53259.1 MFS transporter [Georgenia sp. TF02-10]
MTADGTQRQEPVHLLLVASVALITLAAFESLAVATVMPRVAEDLGGLSLYAVAAGAPLAAQLIGTAVAGAWSDSRGPVGSLVTGIVLFCGGLVLAGLAPTMAVLAVGRGVQGLGAGLLMVPLYVLVGAVVPAAQQPRFFAAFAAAWVVPGLVGPAVAGLVAEHLTWRLVLLVVPVLTVLVAVVFLPRLRTVLAVPARTGGGGATRRLVLAAVGAGLAAAALQVAGSDPGPTALALAGGGLVLLVLSVPVLVPAGTLTLRAGVPAAIACRGLLNASFVAAETFLPLLLVRVHGWSVALAGVVLTVSSLTWAGGSAVQGRVRDPRWRSRLTWLGPSLLALGTTATAAATAPGVPPTVVVLGWTVAGAGIGLVFPALSVLVLQGTAPERHGQVSSALQISDALGAALGLAAAGALVIGLVDRGGTVAYLAGLLVAAGLAVLAAVAGSRASAAPAVVETPSRG